MSHSVTYETKQRSRRGAAQLTEFAAALYLIVILFIFAAAPCRYAVGLMAAQLLTTSISQNAARELNFDRAHAYCCAQMKSFEHSPMAIITGVAPSGGMDYGAHLSFGEESAARGQQLAISASQSGARAEITAYPNYLLINHFVFKPLVAPSHHVCFTFLRLPGITEPIPFECKSATVVENPDSINSSEI